MHNVAATGNRRMRFAYGEFDAFVEDYAARKHEAELTFVYDEVIDEIVPEGLDYFCCSPKRLMVASNTRSPCLICTIAG